MKKVDRQIALVIVAHSDDETIGMGGTIVKHIEKNDLVYVVSMTNGVGARDNFNENHIKSRSTAAQKAAKKLGLSWLESASFPDNELDSIPLLKIIKFIEEIKKQINPTIIYTHSCSDLNIDHKVVGEAALVAFRPQAGETWEEIRTFEVPSATDYGHRSIRGLFSPNLFVDIQKEWPTKLAALLEYQDEIRDAPNSRSIEGIQNLAKLRGNQVGLHYAEAFEVIRKIER